MICSSSAGRSDSGSSVTQSRPPFPSRTEPHRIAISNARILGIDDETVTFRYTDYADAQRCKVMRLTGVEFVRRFLLHVLPKGFMRIRHYGFLANRARRVKLARIGECLTARHLSTSKRPQRERTRPRTSTRVQPVRPVCCASGRCCQRRHDGRADDAERLAEPMPPTLRCQAPQGPELACAQKTEIAPESPMKPPHSPT
ncbi:transposase [Nitrococcus mobilis Nb-231]|uniref:Transposase n=1 Tax=Nitrococcus mobilis Nb-231 TaxID=314278 RepID=A4BMP6_9GAMM|nr:transposase [Nitrococcus mobilis Nb-231]